MSGRAARKARRIPRSTRKYLRALERQLRMEIRGFTMFRRPLSQSCTNARPNYFDWKV